MEHYICTGGCMGVADKPGACNSASCPLYGKTLEVCDCKDGKHYGKQAHTH